MNETFQRLGFYSRGYSAAPGRGYDALGGGGLRPVHLPAGILAGGELRRWGMRRPLCVSFWPGVPSP